MSQRHLVAVITLTAVVLLVPLGAAAQSGDVPRTPWGTPDLQGVWDFATMTPMERPEQFAGQTTLTEEDAATVVENANQRWQRISEGGDNSTGTYDEFWFDAGTGVTEDRRTSLITNPSNGRVPTLTPTAAERVAARRAYLRDHPADSWEDRNIAERCILGFNTGPPMSPSAYNNVFQLFQTEDHVVLLNEMVHDSRIVPLDNSFPSATAHAPVAWRLAGLLGRRHTGGRNHQPHEQDELSRIHREHATRRAFHPLQR